MCKNESPNRKMQCLLLFRWDHRIGRLLYSVVLEFIGWIEEAGITIIQYIKARRLFRIVNSHKLINLIERDDHIGFDCLIQLGGSGFHVRFPDDGQCAKVKCGADAGGQLEDVLGGIAQPVLTGNQEIYDIVAVLDTFYGMEVPVPSAV